MNEEVAYIIEQSNLVTEALSSNNAGGALKTKTYTLTILKIAAFIIIPLTVALVIFLVFKNIKNKRPYYFPDTNYTKRFEADYSATSVARAKK